MFYNLNKKLLFLKENLIEYHKKLKYFFLIIDLYRLC